MSQPVAHLLPNIKNRVAIITGASRGIGRHCALSLAKLGCHVVIAATSDMPKPTLPGTIFTVAEEVEKLSSGSQALPIKCDIRNEDDCINCVAKTVERFGRVDILINNASALWWMDITETPIKRYNLINEINCRGSFMMTKACIPHMRAGDWGHVINMSPPIRTKGIATRTAYYVSKFGMTLVALGVGEENPGVIAGNSLWPKTVIESLASENFQLGPREFWRKASIISDSVLAILSQSPKLPESSGNMWIDEDLLRSVGVTDFSQYQCVPGSEPPSMDSLLSGEGIKEAKRSFATKSKSTGTRTSKL